MWNIYEIHICTAVVNQSEEWSSQQCFQLKQLEGRSLKNTRVSMGFESVTSTILVRCSTNWAMKPHIGSEVNLLSSYLPMQGNDVKYKWNPYLYCGCRYNIFHIISLHGKIWSQQIDLAPNELNKLASLPMYGFTAQLVEHRTGITEITGLNIKLCAKTAICLLTLHRGIYHTLSLIQVLVLYLFILYLFMLFVFKFL